MDRGRSLPLHHQLLGFPDVELQVVSVAPSYKALKQVSVLLLLIIFDAYGNGGVICELLEVASSLVEAEVCGVEGEQKWCQDSSLGCASFAHDIRQAALLPDVLWPVSVC